LPTSSIKGSSVRSSDVPLANAGVDPQPGERESFARAQARVGQKVVGRSLRVAVDGVGMRADLVAPQDPSPAVP
jgi:hypothetical protein